MVSASMHHATLVSVATNNKVNAYISDHTHRTTEAQPAYARTVAKKHLAVPFKLAAAAAVLLRPMG